MTRRHSHLLGPIAALLATAAPALAQDDTILIGGAMSLTGVQAPLDTPALRGAEVAVKYLNDNGGILGKQVELRNIDGNGSVITPTQQGITPQAPALAP